MVIRCGNSSTRSPAWFFCKRNWCALVTPKWKPCAARAYKDCPSRINILASARSKALKCVFIYKKRASSAPSFKSWRKNVFSRYWFYNQMVPRERLELSCPCERWHLKPVRLPVPPPRHHLIVTSAKNSIRMRWFSLFVKQLFTLTKNQLPARIVPFTFFAWISSRSNVNESRDSLRCYEPAMELYFIARIE